MSPSPLKQFRIWGHRNLSRFGIDIRKRRQDRKVLEQVIFPELLRSPKYKRILFVGCAWYTLHYPKLFSDREFITMEISPEEARYGAKTHIVDTCENIGNHFSAGSLDVVILNGVYGFGLNQLPAIERTLRATYHALTDEGLFILGWNDLPNHSPYPIEQIERLTPLKPYVFPPLSVSVYESDAKNRHRFHFYRKDSA
jgi:hypothetical protein